MPLALSALKQGLERVFAAPPATHAACARGWADAVESYATGIVPPSTTVSAAASALASALSTAFQAPDAVPGMESAFAAFGVALGGGMAGYAPVPPPAPVGFAQLFIAAKPETHADAATRVGDAIHAWLTTGVSTLVAPPNTPVPWS